MILCGETNSIHGGGGQAGPLITAPPSLFLLPRSEFTNSKANGSRAPKFNLINTLCVDLQRPNVLLDGHSASALYRETYFTSVLKYIQVLMFRETSISTMRTISVHILWKLGLFISNLKLNAQCRLVNSRIYSLRAYSINDWSTLRQLNNDSD